MRPRSRQLAPGAGTAMLPPLGRQGAAPGDQRAPPTPPPSPSGPRTDRGRPKKRRPRSPPEEAAAPRGRGHHGRGRRPHALPAAGRRRTGGAQDGANGAAPSEAGAGETGAQTRVGGFPPPSPPPPPRTDPLAADRTPTARLYPGGARRRQRLGRAVCRSSRIPPPRVAVPSGGGGASPRLQRRSRSLLWLPSRGGGATGATCCPSGAGGTPPLPQRGPRRGGGGCGWTCTPRAPAPPAACSRGGRDQQASPHQRAGATRGPSLGAAHGGAPEQYGGRAPHDPPMTTAHSGRTEGGFRSAGAPGRAVHGPPLILPHPGTAP